MNYRHAYHAGNFADVLKHLVLVLVVEHLKKKPAPFRIIDTHAGLGLYDLTSEAARKTGEAQAGIARLLSADIPAAAAAILAPYLDLVRELQTGGFEVPRSEARGTDAASFGAGPAEAVVDDAASGPAWYPGSPEIARRLMRPGDVLVANELHPEDAAHLGAHFHRDRQTKVMTLDGFTALKALLPPKERRGVVLIDPPFEEQGEFQRLVIALEDAARRFATGTVIVWYPVKDRAAVGRFHAAIRSSRLAKVLMVSLAIRGPDAAASGAAAAGFRGKGLGEAGLVVVNPPYTLHDDLAAVLPTLRDVLAEAPGYGFQLEWLVAERAKA